MFTFLLVFFACAASARDASYGRTVVPSITAGTFTAGVYDPAATCYTQDRTGTVDYTSCCPVGFEPVSLAPDTTTVQCLETR